MSDFEAILASGVGLIAILFAIVLAILWLLVPFAIFGIKPLLRSILRELQIRNGTLPENGAGPEEKPVEFPTTRNWRLNVPDQSGTNPR